MNNNLTSNKIILVADDDPGILEVINIILSDRGYQVITVDNPTAISKTIEKNHPNLILMDLWMSGMDGHEVTKILKEKSSSRHLPVIIISALSEGKKIAMDAGANGFLAKPFEIEDLLAIVEKYIS